MLDQRPKNESGQDIAGSDAQDRQQQYFPHQVIQMNHKVQLLALKDFNSPLWPSG